MELSVRHQCVLNKLVRQIVTQIDESSFYLLSETGFICCCVIQKALCLKQTGLNLPNIGNNKSI